LVYFPSFGMMYIEKSGNPGAGNWGEVDFRIFSEKYLFVDQGWSKSCSSSMLFTIRYKCGNFVHPSTLLWWADYKSNFLRPVKSKK
jgi:hypothetical protein